MTAFDEPAIGSATDTQAYRFLDTLSYVHVSGAATDGRVAVIEMRLREDHAPPMHVHEAADETIHVTDGRVALHTPDGETTLDVGHSTVLPRGEPHSLVAVEASTIVTTTTPGGFDEFVTAVGEPTDDETVPSSPPAEDAIGRVNALASDHDIEIVGPPPGAP